MNSEGLKRKLEALRVQRARIDRAVEQLEAQILAQDLAEKSGSEVLVVEPDGGWGSYVLQRVLCGNPSCRCAKTGGELHRPYWYHYRNTDRKMKSKYVGKMGLRRARETAKVEVIAQKISARVIENEYSNARSLMLSLK